MGGNAEKTKFSIRVDTDLVELADTYIRSSTVKNRTELIEDALRFYLGFLTAQKAEDYLLQSLSSVMTGTVQDSENRLARMDFKIAVELSKLLFRSFCLFSVNIHTGQNIAIFITHRC